MIFFGEDLFKKISLWIKTQESERFQGRGRCRYRIVMGGGHSGKEGIITSCDINNFTFGIYDNDELYDSNKKQNEEDSIDKYERLNSAFNFKDLNDERDIEKLKNLTLASRYTRHLYIKANQHEKDKLSALAAAEEDEFSDEKMPQKVIPNKKPATSSQIWALTPLYLTQPTEMMFKYFCLNVGLDWRLTQYIFEKCYNVSL